MPDAWYGQFIQIGDDDAEDLPSFDIGWSDFERFEFSGNNPLVFDGRVAGEPPERDLALTVLGTENGDTMIAGTVGDFLYGRGGDDYLAGAIGGVAARLDGGDGVDTLDVAGAAVAAGGLGDDLFWANDSRGGRIIDFEAAGVAGGDRIVFRMMPADAVSVVEEAGRTRFTWAGDGDPTGAGLIVDAVGLTPGGDYVFV